MPNIVGIKFNDTSKTYYFAPQDIVFAVGEGAIVETARGLEYGKVAIANKEVADTEIVDELKPVIRKATDKDLAHYKENIAKKPETMKTVQEKIRKHNLAMKLTGCDYTFDNSKLIIYFTSETRVDFRDLVKDLAGIFHLRIELRQIGIRDECKMLGGFGPCGRPCCCSSYLDDFAKVSIKMAKTQGLSLNPAKISGLCGRLMCCLKYENQYYADATKLMPKLGSEIDTPDGKAIVIAMDVLKQTVKARISLKADEYEIREYNVANLKLTARLSDDIKDSPDDNSDVLPASAENDAL